MKRLWAPWRMQYIARPRTPGCFLCDLRRRRADRRQLVLRRGQTGLLILNRFPYNNGHLLAAPYRHVAALGALRDDERLELLALAEAGCQALRAVARPDGFNLGLNLGRVAGAGVQGHIHLHVVPRWNGDTNFMSVLAGVKVIPEALDVLWLKLRRALDAAPR